MFQIILLLHPIVLYIIIHSQINTINITFQRTINTVVASPLDNNNEYAVIKTYVTRNDINNK